MSTEVETQIARFADIVGLMKPSAIHRKDGHVSSISLGDDFGGMSMGTLAAMGRDPGHPMMQMVETACAGLPNENGDRIPCPDGARFSCISYFASVTVCDSCGNKNKEAQTNNKKRKDWEAICPASFLDTDRAHAGFPKKQYNELKTWAGDRSLFFYGQTGMGKSRLAVVLLKRAMHLGKGVGILWPEELRTLVSGFDTATFDGYANVPVLLIDDPLLTACRESKLIDALKNLFDKRMRKERVTIFTSQIGTEAELVEGKEYKDARDADIERIKALLRRLNETCTVVRFSPIPPPMPIQDEAPFG